MTRKFEEIPVWIKARQLTKQIYRTTQRIPFRVDHGLVDQITRASVSIMSNIAEGIERGSTNELLSFLYIAKGSAGEVRCQLYVAEDQDYISNHEAAELVKSVENISLQLTNWIKSLQTIGTDRGPRHNIYKSEIDKKYETQRKLFEQKLERDLRERQKAETENRNVAERQEYGWRHRNAANAAGMSCGQECR